MRVGDRSGHVAPVRKTVFANVLTALAASNRDRRLLAAPILDERHGPDLRGGDGVWVVGVRDMSVESGLVCLRGLKQGDAVGGGDGEGVGDDRRVRKYVDGVGVAAAATVADAAAFRRGPPVLLDRPHDQRRHQLGGRIT